MSLKRISIATVLIAISLILVYPQSEIPILNWGNHVINVIFSAIPVILVGWGSFKIYKIISSEEFDFSLATKTEGDEEVISLTIDSPWTTEDGWQGPGVEIDGAQITNGKLKIKDGETFSHYVKRFEDSIFEKIIAEISIPEPQGSELWLRIKTSDDSEFEEIKDSVSFQLDDGKFEKELDLDWGSFTFFKFLPEREEESVKSPAIKSIKIEGEKGVES